MGRKKEMQEMENPVMEENSVVGESAVMAGEMYSERETVSSYGSVSASRDGENSFGADGFLDDMGQLPETGSAVDEDAMPELTEDEIFGEEPTDGILESAGDGNKGVAMGDAGAGESRADDWEAGIFPEDDAGREAMPVKEGNGAVEPTAVKPKRASRRKKTKTSADAAEEEHAVGGVQTEKDGNLLVEELSASAEGNVVSVLEGSSSADMDSARDPFGDSGYFLDTADSASEDTMAAAGTGNNTTDTMDTADIVNGTDMVNAADSMEAVGSADAADSMEIDEGAYGFEENVFGTAGNEKSVHGPQEQSATLASQRVPKARKTEAPVLTLEVRGEVETEESREEAVWHEIHNAYRTRRMLTGQLGGIEQTDNGKTIAVVDYKGFRIVIPLKEMMINVGRSPSGQEYAELMLRQNKILGNMLGAEIDFTVKGIDSKTRSVVASRREAMLKKRQIFYLDMDAAGMYRIYEGRIVQARVIAVAEKVLRVEIFGVECSIMARDLAWDWIGDAHERFSVGDQVLVRILGVRRDSLEEISVKADIKSVSQNTSYDNLKKCRIQSKYAGKVTDVHKGVVYIRLSNGVNAVAHSCYDYRTPGKKDDVSFAVTRIDEERGVAVGIITRIIRQNL